MTPAPELSAELPTGIIVAGGRSSRMGASKATLTVGGVPMVVRVARALWAVCGELIVAGGDVELAQLAGGRTVPDPEEGLGPLAGLCAGLRAASAARCVVVGCDMPFVDPRVLAFLIGLDAADAVVPRESGRAEPLHAVYRTAVADVVCGALASGVRRAAEVLERLDVRYVDEAEWRSAHPSGRSWWNVNTPADLERAERLAVQT